MLGLRLSQWKSLHLDLIQVLVQVLFNLVEKLFLVWEKKKN